MSAGGEMTVAKTLGEPYGEMDRRIYEHAGRQLEADIRGGSARRKMPAQKPGKSKQDYGTPKVFLDAVKKRFNIARFCWDLAATAENAIDGLGAERCYFGPGRDRETDALASDCDWRDAGVNLWLNPPFADIAPWARKCAASAWWESEKSKRGPGAADGRRIFFLVPAAVGSNWLAQHVDKKALVLLLNGRISFDGKNPYPKDCLLAVYGLKPDYEVWRWAGAPLK